jgi:lipopolysaccharide transport system permease protein
MSNALPVRETLIQAQAKSRLFSLRELWDYRDLLFLLARRDVAVRYRQAALGMAWAVLQPLGTVLILSVVFGHVVRVSSDDVPYPLFLFAAYLPWQFFSSSLTATGDSISRNPNLITKVYFPRLLIPVAAMGAPLVDMAVATVLMAVLMLIYGQALGPAILWLPLIYLIAAMIALGVGSFVAAMSVSYRDFRHILPFIILSWYWLTPVIYPLTMVPEKWRIFWYLNPMTGVVGGLRAAWFGHPQDFTALAISLAWGLLLLWAGVSCFRRMERRFADVI